MTVALYPGSFDPITNGHLNIIERGLRVFDELIIAVAKNIEKSATFSIEERLEMIQACTGKNSAVKVVSFDGLLVDYAKACRANVILRGLRAVSDFEFEFQMTHMNRRLAPDIETIFMMTGQEEFYVSSKLVREIASLGGSVQGLVPPLVEERLNQRFR